MGLPVLILLPVPVPGWLQELADLSQQHLHVHRLVVFDCRVRSLNVHRNRISGKRSVAFSGCLSRIPDSNFYHPGSEFFISWIRIKEFKYFNPKKLFLSTGKYDLGRSSGIRSFYPTRIPDPQYWENVTKLFVLR